MNARDRRAQRWLNRVALLLWEWGYLSGADLAHGITAVIWCNDPEA